MVPYFEILESGYMYFYFVFLCNVFFNIAHLSKRLASPDPLYNKTSHGGFDHIGVTQIQVEWTMGSVVLIPLGYNL